MSKGKNTMLTNLEDCPGLPPWVLAMRRAAKEALGESDVVDIVKGQVARAKQGDQGAIKFVFDQLLGGNELKGATFVQNNFYGTEDEGPKKPCGGAPGSGKKVRTLQQRAAAGLPLHVEGDGGEVNLE